MTQQYISHFHNGVEIHEVKWFSKSFFYPSFNGNIEFTSLDDAKQWIDGPYQYVRQQCDWLGEQLGVSGNRVFHFMNNLSIS